MERQSVDTWQVGWPDEDDGNPFGCGRVSSSNDLPGSAIAPHRIDRDREHQFGPAAQPTSTATRSLYQPQALHTVWGNLADPQRGQMLRDGAANFHAPARWLRVFIFDFFFLGTATVVLPGAKRAALG